MKTNVVPVPADAVSISDQLAAERPSTPNNAPNVVVRSQVSTHELLLALGMSHLLKPASS